MGGHEWMCMETIGIESYVVNYDAISGIFVGLSITCAATSTETAVGTIGSCAQLLDTLEAAWGMRPKPPSGPGPWSYGGGWLDCGEIGGLGAMYTPPTKDKFGTVNIVAASVLKIIQDIRASDL